MAYHNRGRPLARHTKVVDSCHGPLKNGSKPDGETSCDNDTASLKPTSVGRAVAEVSQEMDNTCIVSKCGSSRCKTCKHIVESKSNTTNRTYKVISKNEVMTCGTKNVIYLISCRRCGIQYIGETSQALRNRMNNHRQRLSKSCDLFLYKQFSTYGHCEDDMLVMPIEEVIVDEKECMNIASKRLEREE